MENFRFGIVGLGHRGRQIAKLAVSFPGVTLVAACDIRARNWWETQWLANEPMAETFPDTVFYQDYEKMLDKANLDAVIVETGADIHCDFCCKALERNIHVFAEIPLVASLQEAERIWKAAEQSSAVLSVGANPNYQRFADFLVEFHQKVREPLVVGVGTHGENGRGLLRRLPDPLRLLKAGYQGDLREHMDVPLQCLTAEVAVDIRAGFHDNRVQIGLVQHFFIVLIKNRIGKGLRHRFVGKPLGLPPVPGADVTGRHQRHSGETHRQLGDLTATVAQTHDTKPEIFHKGTSFVLLF